VPAHIARLGTLMPRRGYEGKCPPTLHSWVPSSHQGSQERRFESRKRLRKIGSCSFLNSQKEQIPTQSPPAVARKIHRGRARVCRGGARRPDFPANHSLGNCGHCAACACASARPYSGP
jgi:hypothetical protein